MSFSSSLNRRRFLGTAALGVTASPFAVGATPAFAIALDPADAVASSAPAKWAAGELQRALEAKGAAVRRCAKITEAAAGEFCIAASGPASTLARDVLKASPLPDAREALALAPAKVSGRQVLLAAGRDSTGLVYALLELADRVTHASDAGAALALDAAVVEQPANVVRSVTRMFCCDVEDLPWYNNREMWPRYLTMLAGQRFNRFNLALGIGYDFIRNVTDAYFEFAYPFLLDVPGYKVRVPQLPNAERDRNLEMLRFISEQTVARGMEFQLGIWMHGYEWIDSPKANYTIEGLNKENHGPYCRDAMRALLKAVPAISGVTLRVHGESGVEEGSYDFWKAVFEGVATCGRKVEIDMHAKGMDQTMMDLAVNTKQPVKISPKYWAEHLGMPYHQADIRELERPKPNARATGLMKFSAGSRSFLRYGYGDLLREDRKWGVLHRIWPGTQRLLLWGDPVTAAAHARSFSFCGSDGVEIMEPLGFKGRRGSGIAGNRGAYADASLAPRWDWEKYVYGHRVWGRLLYNPKAAPETWRRYLTAQFGPGGAPMEQALANASRILPIITVGHGTSAGNNTYWPEVYLNHSLVDAAHPGPYSDTPQPRVFGNVSPMDPQLFSRINDHADALLNGECDGKYSPIEVAQWIEDYAAAAARHLENADKSATGKDGVEYRRWSIDIAMQAGIGRFFAARFRSGVLYRIFEKTGDRAALEESLKQYRAARDAFAEVANRGKVYVPDITVGETRQLRGHWLDRLPAMDADIAAVAAKLPEAKEGMPRDRVAAAIKAALASPRRALSPSKHTPPARFKLGQAIALEIAPGGKVASARLYYRHVTHEERYQMAEMTAAGNVYRASIPASYTNGEYPIEYYFELRQGPDAAWLHPGFPQDLAGQPYHVVRRA